MIDTVTAMLKAAGFNVADVDELEREMSGTSRPSEAIARVVTSLKAENERLRAKYADNWHDPPEVGDHRWVKMTYSGKAEPMPYVPDAAEDFDE